MSDIFSEKTPLIIHHPDGGDRLIAEYADGGLNHPGRLNQKLGYPRDWLETTSWPHGPTRYDKPE